MMQFTAWQQAQSIAVAPWQMLLQGWSLLSRTADSFFRATWLVLAAETSALTSACTISQRPVPSSQLEVINAQCASVHPGGFQQKSLF